jgi:phage tail tape-measure protein
MAENSISIKIQADATAAKKSMEALNRAVRGVGDAAKASSEEQAAAVKIAARASVSGTKDIIKAEQSRLKVTKQLSRAVDSLRASVSKSGAAWAKFSATATRSMSMVKTQVFSIQSAIVAIGAGAAAKSMFDVAVSFETLELSLRTVTGSAEEAKKAMDWITEFTATTPYELEEVANAFKKLSSYGLAPQKYLRSLGDTAAAMGKTLDQAVEMFADATTGQFERLKEFGIRANSEGEKVTFSWLQNGRQMQKSVEKTGAAISGALGEIMQARFAGGMELLASGWAGMWSNLRDQLTLFSKAVMDAGVFDYLKQRLSEILSTLTQMTRDGSLKQMAQDIGQGVTGALDKLGSAITNLKRVYDTIPDGLGLMIFGAAWGAMSGARGGVAGAVAGAQAGAVIGGTISLVNALSQSFEGLKRAASGEIGIWDYITSNRQELERILDEADAERVAKEEAKNAQIEALDAEKNKNLLAQYRTYIDAATSAETASRDARKAIEDDLAAYRAVKWDEVIKVIKSKLKEAEAEEKKYSDMVKALQEERDQAGLSTQEKVRAMLRTQMSDYDAYQDKLREANESANKAKLALSGGDGELAESWAKKAQEQFASLNYEVKDGERTLVSAAQANSVAVEGVLRAGQLLEQSLLTQEKAAEANRKKWEGQVSAYEADLAKIKEMQATVEQLEMRLSADDKATPVLNAIQRELAAIKDKTVTVTVRYRKVQENAAGGLIQAFANGGQAFRRVAGRIFGPGTGTSDSIPAMLSNGEFVIRAAMVRKWGAAFFQALNAGIMPPMPKYATGGAVAASVGSGTLESMNVNFRVGDVEIPVRVARSDKSMVKTLVKELNRERRIKGIS